MVECDLAKVEVAGSNPVSRSSKKLMGSGACRGPFCIVSTGTEDPACALAVAKLPAPPSLQPSSHASGWAGPRGVLIKLALKYKDFGV